MVTELSEQQTGWIDGGGPQKRRIIEWKHNGLRQTCASMHLAHFSNEAYTALQLGHSVDMLHRHYKGLVTREQAAAFWVIETPSCKLEVKPNIAS